MREEKRAIVLEILQEKLDALLFEIEQKDSLDYFKIEIVNHNGNLQLDYILRDRVKAY